MDASSSSSRQELTHNAVLFLNDPKVQSSSLTSRIQFLESKGLNEQEIQQALQQASQGSSNSSASHAPPQRPNFPAPRYGYEYGTLAPPEPPRRDWRDLFIMAVVSGGVVYGLTALAKKYLVPHLRPPSTTSFQETSTSLTAQYDEAARLLAELSEQTTKLQTTIEEDRERVNAVVGEVEEAVRGVKDGEERWREEMRDIRGEVESVRELVPKMIEKHAQTQSAALTDLQAELRSLKTLLLSRQQQQSASTNGSSGSSGGVSSTTAAANALLGPRTGAGKASIPAWQMAPTGSGSGTGNSSPMNGTVLLEKEKAKEEVKEDGGNDQE
ncbi:hypothetical protein IAR55_004614 [Kwoniella newhampshirensis]|uniref:Peroxisomal membrane protein PEX14 n=1 Tax=Kwoniella newhampshirensis TaxID=1651941 RepID=A0AAW0YY01_9TREE